MCSDKRPVDPFWPAATSDQRPWTRWWWLGSAVERATIADLLETYRAAGLGGVEITCIYGVRGNEANNIDFLSREWIDRVRYTISEAHRLGLRVDLPPGSGWRIGGPFITPDTAAATLQIEGDSKTGYRVKIVPSGERVKRPGPGGSGLAFNPFSRHSLQKVMDRLTPVFGTLGLRAQFHDSWEYGSDGCPEFLEAFRALRGYDLQEHLATLAGEGPTENVARVRYDVRATFADLALDAFIRPWTEWCHRLGHLSRNQAHGSPGNLLDLYAAADIPETEVFREVNADTPLLSKFASSAAHVTSKQRVSSETGTWIDEHFHVSLAKLKHLVDNLFVSGINQHVYHGTAYSPPDAEWPGYLFYASAQLNPANPIWRDFPKLNEYVTRCQSLLQNGTPDNDLLVYFPMHDLFHRAEDRWIKPLIIKGDWLNELPASATFRTLWQRGYGFDYVSDRQLLDIQRSAAPPPGTPGGGWRAILVPPCRFLPLATLETLVDLTRRGAKVVFLDPLPADVPGLFDLAARRERFARLLLEVEHGGDLASRLERLEVRAEPLASIPALLHIRRRHERGVDYFVCNQGQTPIEAWVELTRPFVEALIMDPMSGAVGRARTRGKSSLFLQLSPGDSLFLRAATTGTATPEWCYENNAGAWRELVGAWRVEFIAGGPTRPSGYTTPVLESWTKRGKEAKRFAGTARYTLRFDAPDASPDLQLDLGTVHASARVLLNGAPVDTLIGPTFKTVLRRVRRRDNLLEIEVTNLAANRIRDLDRRGVAWKRFEDINIVDRSYQPLDASNWPILPSGLLGPVRTRSTAPLRV